MGLWRSIGRALGFGAEAEVPPFPSSELGGRVGLFLETEALRELEERLGAASQATFLEHVRGRVMAVHPDMTDAAYDWTFLELRRFFFMTAIIKEHLPMYSEQADAIWHEMLMFTREYETFCHAFAGRMINHEPHVEKPKRTEAYQKRAVFELMYGVLFQRYPMNETLLGALGKHTFTVDEVTELARLDAAGLQARFFRDTAASSDAAAAMERSIQAGVEAATDRKYRTHDARFSNDYAAGIIAVSLVHSAAMESGDGDGSASFGGDGDGCGGS
jgi:hypothetical protein